MPKGFEDKELFDNLTSKGVYPLVTQIFENTATINKLETKNSELKTVNTNLELELAKLKGKLEVYAELPIVKANLFPDNIKDNRRIA
jgi:regulator of replication initiation timing